jgi:site-specific DNA-cytosine methylase
MGFNVVSLDFDPIYTPTIETDVLKWDYKKYYEDTGFIPDFIWASPPCNTFSRLFYKHFERDPKTAVPKSDRAREGTKILYRTLDIIDYFIKINPNMLYVIENPNGMMRNDRRMKKLQRETTLYCLYGDFKRKSTDFWSNFPLGTQINQTNKQCPNPEKLKVVSIDKMTIEQKYSIPSKLVKHFLEEFLKQYQGRK